MGHCRAVRVLTPGTSEVTTFFRLSAAETISDEQAISRSRGRRALH
jgi:hypothetical protein